MLIHRQEFDWKPKVKDRPRFANGRVYTPTATIKAEQALAAQYDGPLIDRLCRVEFAFSNDQVFMEIYEADDYENRKLRGDVDNYLKLVGDAMNGVAYVDDVQVVKLSGEKL